MKAAARGNFRPADAAEGAAGAFGKKPLRPRRAAGGVRASSPLGHDFTAGSPERSTPPLAQAAPRRRRVSARTEREIRRLRRWRRFNRRKSAQSADKLPVGRPGGGPASAPFRSASQPADTLSQPAGTVRHTADTLSQPAGTARHTAGLISQPAGAASHVSGSARHTAGGVRLVSGTARHTAESARVARFTENCPFLATSQPPARKAGGTPALYPHRAEAAPLARRASQFVNRT